MKLEALVGIGVEGVKGRYDLHTSIVSVFLYVSTCVYVCIFVSLCVSILLCVCVCLYCCVYVCVLNYQRLNSETA